MASGRIRIGYTTGVHTLVAEYGQYSLSGHAANLVYNSESPEWLLASGHYETSKQTLEIIAPRSGLASTSRYLKAYPGIPLNSGNELPIAVIGGSPPYKYELQVAPAGMAIGETLPSDVETNGPGNYGLITWDNPTSGSHPITVRVYDQNHGRPSDSYVEVSWTLEVTTSGFIFVDAVNGHRSAANGGTGTGTLANPFLGIRDWYAGSTGGTGIGTKTNSTYSGYIVYYRAGNYRTDDAYNEDLTTSPRLPLTGTNKPLVHLGYPGETATIDLLNASFSIYSTSSPAFIGNLGFTNLTSTSRATLGYCLNLGYDSQMGDSVFYKLSFSTPVNPGTIGSNASCIMSGRAGIGERHVVSHCTFQSMNQHDTWLQYDVTKGLAEWNTIVGTNAGGNGHGFYSKDSCRSVTVRWNKGLNAGNNTHLARFDGYSGSQAPGNFEVCYNNYSTTGDALEWGPNGSNVGTTWEYRNTWRAGNPARVVNWVAGTINTANNVIRHTGSVLSNSTMTVNGAATNLAATSGLIDSNNLLTGTDRTNNLGLDGHEVA